MRASNRGLEELMRFVVAVKKGPTIVMRFEEGTNRGVEGLLMRFGVVW